MKNCEKFQLISIQNHKSNKGNLNFTFFEILNLLTFKHNIYPSVLAKYDDYGNCIGYCIYYFKDDYSIQISQICIKKEYQNQGIGKYFIDELSKYNKSITADIAIDNIQSQRFFIKNGFNLVKNENKNRYQAKRSLKGEN